MAEKKEEFPFETPQEHKLMCEKHNLMPIDVTCEDCGQFICSTCVKEEHNDHNWQTIQTGTIFITRAILKSLNKIEEYDIQRIEKTIQRTFEEMTENKKRCEVEVSRLQKHFDAIVHKLIKIKNKHEKTRRDTL